MLTSTLIFILSGWVVLNFLLTLYEELSMTDPKNKAEFKLNSKIMVGNLAIKTLCKFLGVALMLTPFMYLKSYQWFSLKGAGWFVLCFVLADFLYFFKHFAHHKVKFFWNQHQVHHSSKRYSLSTGYRMSWAEGFYSFLFYTPLVFLGFPPVYIFACVLGISCYVHLLHTSKSLNLGWLNLLLQSPEEHQIHHSAAPIHLDKNFGGVFNVWDKIFKTHTRLGREDIKFGLTQSFETSCPFKVNFSVWAQDLKKMKELKEKGFLSYYLSSPNALKAQQQNMKNH